VRKNVDIMGDQNVEDCTDVRFLGIKPEFQKNKTVGPYLKFKFIQ
jgi:hypothetical protein